MMEKNYDTLAEATFDLDQRGYTENFKAEENFITALNSGKKYRPQDLLITGYYRFEGKSDPADSVEVFAIEANDNTKGTLVMSYGAKHSQNTDLIREIETKGRD